MIDVNELTKLITQFRNTTQANSVSPENVGSILQKIVDILATAGTQANLDIINQWHEAIKSAQPAINSLAQGTADRNHVYLSAQRINLYTGQASTAQSIQIQQATTERAGAMRAQQVTDLNAARKGVAALETEGAKINNLITQINAKLANVSGGDSSATVTDDGAFEDYKIKRQIAVSVKGDRLVVLGAHVLQEKGYVPYLFRLTKKRNPFKNKFVDAEILIDKKYCKQKKGWNLYGSRYAIRLSDNTLEISTGGHHFFSSPSDTTVGYSWQPNTLFPIHNSSGGPTVPWGKSMVSLKDSKGNYRMLRFRFALAFGKPIEPGRVSISPAHMISTMAEFSVIFDPITQTFVYGK